MQIDSKQSDSDEHHRVKCHNILHGQHMHGRQPRVQTKWRIEYSQEIQIPKRSYCNGNVSIDQSFVDGYDDTQQRRNGENLTSEDKGHQMWRSYGNFHQNYENIEPSQRQIYESEVFQ